MKTSLALALFLALGLCGIQAALLPSPKSGLDCVPIDGWNVLVSYYNGHSFAEKRDYKQIIGTTYSDIAPNSPEADALFREFGDVLGEFGRRSVRMPSLMFILYTAPFTTKWPKWSSSRIHT